MDAEALLGGRQEAAPPGSALGSLHPDTGALPRPLMMRDR
jgi:hypothetical protein